MNRQNPKFATEINESWVSGKVKDDKLRALILEEGHLHYDRHDGFRIALVRDLMLQWKAYVEIPKDHPFYSYASIPSKIAHHINIEPYYVTYTGFGLQGIDENPTTFWIGITAHKYLPATRLGDPADYCTKQVMLQQLENLVSQVKEFKTVK